MAKRRDIAILGRTRSGSGPRPQRSAPAEAPAEAPLTPGCKHAPGTWCPHCQPWMQVVADGTGR